MIQESIGQYIIFQQQDSHLSQILSNHNLSCHLPDRSQNKTKHRSKRISNYIFKGPLTNFKKILLKIFSGNNFATDQVKTICMEKNLATFPKLVCLCEREGVKNQVLEKWENQVQHCNESHNKKLTDDELLQLQQWNQRMASSLKCSSPEQLVNMYWGSRVRHKEKLQKCVDSIRNFNEYEY